MNKVICYKTNDHFTKGKEYNCTDAYAKFENVMVDVVDDQGNITSLDINNLDFDFIFKHINKNIIDGVFEKKDKIISNAQMFQKINGNRSEDEFSKEYNKLYNFFYNNYNDEEIMVIESIMYFGRECYTGNGDEYKGNRYDVISYWVKCLGFNNKEIEIGQMLGKAKLIYTYLECGFAALEKR